jgi:hypothetical protein
MATSSPGTSLERDDGTRLPLRRVAVSKLPAWRQDLFGFRSFTCKSQENREPTSGLEPLTYPHYECDGHYLSETEGVTSRAAVLSPHLQARKLS